MDLTEDINEEDNPILIIEPNLRKRFLLILIGSTLSVFGFVIHLFAGIIFLVSYHNLEAGTWALISGLGAIPVFVIQILEARLFWISHSLRNFIVLGAVEMIVGCSSFSIYLMSLLFHLDVVSSGLKSPFCTLIWNFILIVWGTVLIFYSKKYSNQTSVQYQIIPQDDVENNDVVN